MKKLVALSCLVAGCYTSDENLGFTPISSTRWAVTLGDIHNDGASGVAIDSIGDVVVVGSITANDPFLQDNPTVPWISGAFVTKRVASDGGERWTHRFTSSAGMRSTAGVSSVAIGPDDSIYTVGTYMGTIDFGGQTLTLPRDKMGAFVAALSSTGDLLWIRGLGNAAQATAVAVDAQGRVFVTGSFVKSSIQLGTQVFVESDNDADVFLVAYDPAGSVLWGTAFQGAAPGTISGAGPWVSDLAIAGNGDVLVAGGFSAPISFGGAVLDPQSRSRGFVARYRKDGLYLASQTVGRAAPYVIARMNIAVDTAGRIVVQTAEPRDGSDVVGTPNTIQVLADDGHELWSADVVNHGSASPEVRTLATTPQGLIVSSAWTDAPLADDRASVTGSMEVVAYDADGNPGVATFGSRSYAVPQQTLAWDSAVGASGQIAYTGTFGGNIDFGTGTVAGTRGQGDSDVFVVLVDPSAGP